MADYSEQRLRCERFERKPKEVFRSANFVDHTKRVANESRLLDDLEQIVECIEDGRSLDRRFYRSGLEVDEDPLLEAEGIKHLHLDNMGSDVLLFAVEYADRVVLLEINSHKHFRTEPKGSVLLSLHRQYLRREDAAAERRATSRES